MAFGLAQGYPLAHVLVDTAVPAAFAVAALALGRHRRPASAAVALGLLTCSAIVTHLSGGYIEAHFHFFVIVSLLVLYEDWQPFLLAIGYVLAHHGVMGALDSAGVYNHAGGAADPWKWAGIHAGFIAALSIGSVVSWRLNEDARAESDSAHAETKAALAQATESEQRFRSALESAPIGMALIEPDPRSFGRFRRVNRALCEMTGYSEQELLARDFQSITHPDDLADNLADADALLSGALERYETEKRYLHADGRVIWALVRSSLIPNRDGTPAVFISQMQDITQRKKIEAELSHHALHDSLTGLPNRALFLDRLAQASLHAQPRDGAVGVLFLDLDNFKLVNDTYGHRVGDAVLKAVAERLRGALGHQDTIARFGGDEFAVLCDGSAAARDLSATAARLGETIAARSCSPPASGSSPTTASPGIRTLCSATRTQRCTERKPQAADAGKFSTRSCARRL
jgi:diguanylate cyclase (GGDEF)-like protein/PAS domain S-box-containing protein